MRVLPFALLSALFLVGCGSQPAPKLIAVEKDMEITVDLREEHRCSRISPEIEIPYPPQGTASFQVLLEDVDDRKRMHGGGSWSLEAPLSNGATIVEGGLTQYYTGPCPPNTESRIYQYVVKALDVNKQIVGVGKYTFLQE